MGIDQPECLERAGHLGFFSQRVHTSKGMMRVHRRTRQEARAQDDDGSHGPFGHEYILQNGPPKAGHSVWQNALAAFREWYVSVESVKPLHRSLESFRSSLVLE